MKIRALVPIGALVSYLFWAPVQAAMISVTGGFTNFSTGFVFETTSGGTIAQKLNGQPLCATAGCDVSGPASVTFASPVSRVEFFNQLFGDPSPNPSNVVEFNAAAPQPVNAIGDTFLIGTLTFANGIWSNAMATFDITLATVSNDPAFNGHVLNDQLFMQVTPNNFVNGTPFANSDFVYFTGHPLLGSVRAFELRDNQPGGNTVTVDVFAQIGSLIPVEFSNATGGGFIDPGISIPPTVPLPAAGWLMLTGLAGLARRISRRG